MIYEVLKREILTGEIASGELISETTLSERFQVSRTPIREALARLAGDRLLVALPQRGHLVRTISFAEVIEAFRIRELLEVEAAGEAATRITDSEIKRLEEIFTKSALEAEPLLWNFRIHTEIARLSGNRLLAGFIEETLILMQSVLSNHPGMGENTFENIEPERKVINAIIARDPKAAREAMHYHIQEAKEKMLKANNTLFSI